MAAFWIWQPYEEEKIRSWQMKYVINILHTFERLSLLPGCLETVGFTSSGRLGRSLTAAWDERCYQREDILDRHNRQLLPYIKKDVKSSFKMNSEEFLEATLTHWYEYQKAKRWEHKIAVVTLFHLAACTRLYQSIEDIFQCAVHGGWSQICWEAVVFFKGQ